MGDLARFLDKQIEAVVSGGKRCKGRMVDCGLDLLVLDTGDKFLYLPLVHVQKISHLTVPPEPAEVSCREVPIDLQTETISYRKILMHARGRFLEIYVSGDKSLHGYLTSVMNNYFVFYSPVYKTMYITLDHVKWLEPYPERHTPYSLDSSQLPVNPAQLPLSRTFDEQCRKLVGQLAVFDQGADPDKIGLVRSVENSLIELVTATGGTRYLNIRHLKTVHLP